MLVFTALLSLGLSMPTPLCQPLSSTLACEGKIPVQTMSMQRAFLSFRRSQAAPGTQVGRLHVHLVLDKHLAKKFLFKPFFVGEGRAGVLETEPKTLHSCYTPTPFLFLFFWVRDLINWLSGLGSSPNPFLSAKCWDYNSAPPRPATMYFLIYDCQISVYFKILESLKLVLLLKFQVK